MPDTGGRPNAFYSDSSQIFYFIFLLFISAVLGLVSLGHFLNYTMNYCTGGGLRFTHISNLRAKSKGDEMKSTWEKKIPFSHMIDFNDGLALFWNENPKSADYELHSGQSKSQHIWSYFFFFFQITALEHLVSHPVFHQV